MQAGWKYLRKYLIEEEGEEVSGRHGGGGSRSAAAALQPQGCGFDSRLRC